jgi:hypothetical protein
MIEHQVLSNAFAYPPEYGKSDCGFSHLEIFKKYFRMMECVNERLCGLVVRVLGYRSGGLGSIPGTTRKKKG